MSRETVPPSSVRPSAPAPRSGLARAALTLGAVGLFGLCAVVGIAGAVGEDISGLPMPLQSAIVLVAWSSVLWLLCGLAGAVLGAVAVGPGPADAAGSPQAQGAVKRRPAMAMNW